jgi:mevalonate pyrophosphate decarboxylase
MDEKPLAHCTSPNRFIDGCGRTSAASAAAAAAAAYISSYE